MESKASYSTPSLFDYILTTNASYVIRRYKVTPSKSIGCKLLSWKILTVSLITAMFFTLPNQLLSQDIEKIGEKVKWNLNGYLNLQGTFLASNRNMDLRDNFSWFTSAGITISRGQLNIPVNFTFSNGNAGLNLPSLRRFGVSPYYKWLKVHAGWRNLSFSRYTLDNFSFLGGAVEFTPGNFYLAAMRGRLENQWVQPREDMLAVERLSTPYVRQATGLKLGLQGQENHILLNIFHATDKQDIEAVSAQSIPQIAPAVNLAGGPSVRLTFFNRLTFEGEGALSAVTFNQNSPAGTETNSSTLENQLEALTELNRSTRVFLAGEGSLNFRSKQINLGLKYQRVDPRYQSFGVYYLPRDYENYAISGNVSALKNKVSLGLSYGYQRNNLEQRKANRWRRVGSVNLRIRAGKGFMFSGNYSTIANNQNVGLVAINDTFRVTTTNQTLSVRPVLTFGLKEKKKSITLRYQESTFSSLNPGLASTLGTNRNQQSSLTYTANNRANKFRFRFGLTLRKVEFRGQTNHRAGFRANMNKSMFNDKISTRLGFSWQASWLDNQEDGNISTIHFGLNYQLLKKHYIRISNRLLLRKTIQQPAYNEWRGTVSYGWNF